MFIVIEGPDGVGKTSCLRRVESALSRHPAVGGRAVHVVQDPGTTPAGKAIRQHVLDAAVPMSRQTQVAMFTAARAALADHVRRLLCDGGIVLCDRWLMSTLVYQASVEVSSTQIRKLHDMLVNLDPDLGIYLHHHDPTTLVHRVQSRGKVAAAVSRDRFESDPISKILERYRRYEDWSRSLPGFVRLATTGASEEQVSKGVLELIIPELTKRANSCIERME